MLQANRELNNNITIRLTTYPTSYKIFWQAYTPVLSNRGDSFVFNAFYSGWFIPKYS